MNQTVVELIIGGVTIVFSCMGSAIAVGIFIGGLKSKIDLMSDRLAKIEGMFTLVPKDLRNEEHRELC